MYPMKEELERIKNEVLPVLLGGVKKDGNINP